MADQRKRVVPSAQVPAPLPMDERQTEEIKNIAHQLLSRVDAVEGIDTATRENLGYYLESALAQWGKLALHRKKPSSR